jgi:hypothetical protein
MVHRIPLLAAFVLILGGQAWAQTRIPVAGVEPDVGFCDGVLEVTSRTDGRLLVDLQLKFRDDSTLHISGALDSAGGTKWRGEVKIPPGIVDALSGSTRGELGIVTLDVDPDAGTVQGRYATGPNGVTFEDNNPALPVLDQRKVAPLAADDPREEKTVQVRYYGAAGYHVKRGKDEFLFAPWLSAPSFGVVAASEVVGGMRPDPARISDGLSGTDISRSAAILVGHSHYDHLMDVPEVARKYAPNARIVCSKNSANILAGESDGADLVARTVLVDDRLGQWIPIPGTRVRVMALQGDHPPHLLGIEFYTGTVDQPRTSPPDRGSDWKCGPTDVFLVDFLDQAGKVSYRIYYQDASPVPPKGSVPAAVLAEHRVDLAIYCMSLHEHVKNFPIELTKQLDPRVIVMGHWEDIFSPMPGLGPDRDKPLEDLTLRLVMDTKPREFVRELNTVRSKDSRWIMPLPGSLYMFDPVPAAKPALGPVGQDR